MSFRPVCRNQQNVNFPPIARANLGSTFPRGNLAESVLGGDQSKRVDLADLSWEDKEQVLRMLFAKINHAQQQRRAASAPEGLDGSIDRFDNPAGVGGGLFAGPLQQEGIEQEPSMLVGELSQAMGGGSTASAARPAMA
eukprot:SAG31_NODE_2267_length_6052_cov_7.222241_7_plen_139_part_00